MKIKWPLLLVSIGAICSGGIMVAEESRRERVEHFLSMQSFLERIRAEHPNNVVWDDSEYRLAIPSKYVTDENLRLLQDLPQLVELRLSLGQFTLGITTNGFASLNQLTNLSVLIIQCPRVLEPGVLISVCALKNLRVLTLNAAMPPVEEYSFLTNLTRLEELSLYGVENFGDNELKALERIPMLKRLNLSRTKLSDHWPAVVRKFPALKSAVLWNDNESLEWSRQRE